LPSSVGSPTYSQKRFVGIARTAVIGIEDSDGSFPPWSIINLQPPRSAAGRAPSQILADHWNTELVTEDTKRPDDARGRLTLSNETSPDNETSGDTSPMQDVEAQMRRALGLYGVPRRQEAERAAAPKLPRPADRFGAGGQRRRFAQDGEVPVTVLNGRRDHPADAPVNRLEAAETAVAAERAAREQAERALAEAHATIHDLQTKLGHASLAQTELQAVARRDQEAIAALQAELTATSERVAAMDAAREQLQQRLNTIQAAYAEAQSARKQAERAQREADAARADGERRLRQSDLTAGKSDERPVRRTARPAKETNTAATKPRITVRRGRAQPVAAMPEPQPVQWWLLSPKKTKRQ
jgi:hypothetical protein